MNRLAIIALEVLCPHCDHKHYPEVPLDKVSNTVERCEACKKEFVLRTRPAVKWRTEPDFLGTNGRDGEFDPDLIPPTKEGEFLSIM